ncbi:hypothetical protein P343_08090 [Sporolactobacillus laevolacticus DSM 442]|uniref:DUF1064 domain-containing protein n=2 Tax=Sporolactobacillus laevolacticus TaxID=33018 RepID=V6IXF1_9BACL|nr:hypothetical protein P343_08090 [Sporolactobacillus laevolacticus DSM 442]
MAMDLTETMTSGEYQEMLKKREKKQKFNAKKTTVDGIQFDSEIEARYYVQLKWLKKAGEIKRFERQPRFMLQEAGITPYGEKYSRIEYVADFKVYRNDGSIEIIDVKGLETAVFRMKKKLFMNRYPWPLSLVTYDKDLGWTTLDKLKKRKRK